MAEYDDFKEIAHCGGRATFHIFADAEGRISYSQGFEHSSPLPAAWIGIYARVNDAAPVADFRIGGIGQTNDPPPPPDCISVFLGSDSQQRWGHECPRCGGYFRNGRHSTFFPLTCPYCSLKAPPFAFLTKAQRAYVRHYVETLLTGLTEIEPNSEKHLTIDMDLIADRGEAVGRPDFYYTSETQQTRYTCDHCGEFNDIRGVFGYCASCGWRNNLQSLARSFEEVRSSLNTGSRNAEECLRSAVSSFDACCRDITMQVKKRIPMKESRRSELDRLVFHDIDSPTIDRLRTMFDMDLVQGMNEGDRVFVRLMLQRRHLFEHNSGVADARYIEKSGDTTVEVGTLVRETRPNVHRVIGCLTRMTSNLDRDFHEIFPPTKWPIDYFTKTKRAGEQ